MPRLSFVMELKHPGGCWPAGDRAFKLRACLETRVCSNLSETDRFSRWSHPASVKESFPPTLWIHLCLNVSSLLIRTKMTHNRRRRGWFLILKFAKDSLFFFGLGKEGDLSCACSAPQQTADESYIVSVWFCLSIRAISGKSGWHVSVSHIQLWVCSGNGQRQHF